MRLRAAKVIDMFKTKGVSIHTHNRKMSSPLSFSFPHPSGVSLGTKMHADVV